MGPLRLNIRRGDFETQTSMASRLAARNGRDTLQAFCKDVGVTIDSIITGKPQALERLATLTGVPLALIESSCIRDLADKKTKQLGHEVIWLNDLKPVARVCPVCARDSLKDLPRDAFFWGVPDKIDHWIDAVETCIDHGVVLLTLDTTSVPTSYSRHPIERARIVAANEALIRAAIQNPQYRKPLAYEVYLANRVRGLASPKNDIIDKVPVTTVSEILDGIGTAISNKIILEGATSSAISELRRPRREIGFEVFSGSYDEFSKKMLEIWPNETSSVVSHRFSGFGRWVADRPNSKSIEPVRQAVARLIGDTSGAGPGDRILGVAMNARGCHSVVSVARETNRKPEFVFKIAKDTGLLDDGVIDRPLSQCILPLEVGNQLIECLRTSVSATEFAKKLNVDPYIIRSLIDAGLLWPIPGTVSNGSSPLFAHEHITDFEQRLEGALPVEPSSVKIPINVIVRRTKARISDLIAALLEGMISGERTTEMIDIKDIRLSAKEVVKAQKHPGFIRTSAPAVRVRTSKRDHRLSP